MSTSSYPVSVDNSSTLPNPTTGSATNSPSHAALHTTENGAIEALEAKVGTGATTPAANNVLLGTGTGTSAWGQLSSSQWASVLTDETGSGLSVFNNAPTLVTPKVDTINESTSDNGVTIDGLNIKDGVLNSANSVAASNIQAGAVGATNLSSSAIKLGRVSITSSQSTSSTSFIGIPGMTVSVVAPGSRDIEIILSGRDFFVSSTTAQIAIFRGATSGALTTQLGANLINSSTAPISLIAFDPALAAGTYYYTAAFSTANASDAVTVEATIAAPLTLAVKAI